MPDGLTVEELVGILRLLGRLGNAIALQEEQIKALSRPQDDEAD